MGNWKWEIELAAAARNFKATTTLFISHLKLTQTDPPFFDARPVTLTLLWRGFYRDGNKKARLNQCVYTFFETSLHYKPAVPLKLHIAVPLFGLHQALCLYAAFTGSAYLHTNGLWHVLGPPARKGWAFEDAVISLAAGGRLSGHGMSPPSSSSPLMNLFSLWTFYHSEARLSNDDSVNSGRNGWEAGGFDKLEVVWEEFQMGNGKLSQPKTLGFQGNTDTIHFPFDISHLKRAQTDPCLRQCRTIRRRIMRHCLKETPHDWAAV